MRLAEPVSRPQAALFNAFLLRVMHLRNFIKIRIWFLFLLATFFTFFATDELLPTEPPDGGFPPPGGLITCLRQTRLIDTNPFKQRLSGQARRFSVPHFLVMGFISGRPGLPAGLFVVQQYFPTLRKRFLH